MLPAAAQGAIGIEARRDDDGVNALLAHINHPATFDAVECERAMLRMLDGSCRTPIAGYAVIEHGQLHLRAQVVAPDGSDERRAEARGSVSDGIALGESIGRALKRETPSEWLVQHAQ